MTATNSRCLVGAAVVAFLLASGAGGASGSGSATAGTFGFRDAEAIAPLADGRAILAYAADTREGASAARLPSPSRGEILVTSLAPIAAFAQNDRHIAWVAEGEGGRRCSGLFRQELETRARTRLSPRAGLCDDVANLVLAGDGAYWEARSGTNVFSHSTLYTVTPRERTPLAVAWQSVRSWSFDSPVAAAGDGRSVYFWTSPDDGASGPLVRIDGERPKDVTPTLRRLQALAAGEGRYAFATAAAREFDCALEPAWSPDGRRIAFASTRAAVPHRLRPCRGGIWLTTADGRDARRIAAAGRSPDWSPDGGRLVYATDEGDLVVVPLTGESGRVIARGTDPAWSPDGARIAFVRGSTVVVTNVDGTGERRVMTGAADPEWSPDGTRIVFARTEPSKPGLGIVDADGSDAQTLTVGEDRRPAWSPDGRLIAYEHCSSAAHCLGGSGGFDISVITPSGGGNRTRVSLSSHENTSRTPAWSPDSAQLLYAESVDWTDDGDSHLYVVPLRRGSARQLTHTPVPKVTIVVRTRGGRAVRPPLPASDVVALAVSGSVTAALRRGSSGMSLELYTPRRRSVSLAAGVAPELSASGKRLVFRVRRVIYAVDAVTGRRHVVVTTASRPIGLSIVGRRIAWAENVGGRGYVRAMRAP